MGWSLPGVETGRLAGHPFVRVRGRGRARSRGLDLGLGPDPGLAPGRTRVRTGIDGHDGGSDSDDGGSVGRGDDGPGRPLVVVPGLNDPLQRVGDSWWFAAAMAAYARRYARGRPVYVVSRPRELPEGTDTRGMARGYGRVLEGVCDREASQRADAMGISMGGFLVTHLAADHPGVVGRAVLALAADRLASRGRRLIRRWIEYARRGRWLSVYLAAADVVARGWRRRALRAAARCYDRIEDPIVPRDFRITARATLDHDAADRLAGVERPTLVVGGDGDPFFSIARFRETAGAMPAGRFARLRGASHEAAIQYPGAFEAPIRTFLGPGIRR